MTVSAAGLCRSVPVGVDPDVDSMRSIVARLAADDLAGRRIGTSGGRAAAGWLAAQLRAIGAEVAFDEFTVPAGVREVYATPRLALSGHDGLEFRRDFCEHLASADAADARRGPVVSLGGDLAGAWVLDSAWSADRAAAVGRAGALGVLLPRGRDSAGWMPKMIAGPATAGLPILAVRSDVHAALPGDGSVIAEASVPVRMVAVDGNNVIGTFRHGRPTSTNVLLTAHFDGVGDDSALRFPAACDNAAGVAVVIEAGRILHAWLPPDIGLRVALLDGEEAGARGSAHLASQIERGTYVINLDGAAQLAGAAHVEAGGPAEQLLEALDAAARQVGVPLMARPMPSDNRRFAAAGLPAVGIGMGMPGYQTPAETPDRVEDATLVVATELVIATVNRLVEGAGHPFAAPSA